MDLFKSDLYILNNTIHDTVIQSGTKWSEESLAV